MNRCPTTYMGIVFRGYPGWHGSSHCRYELGGRARDHLQYRPSRRGVPLVSWGRKGRCSAIIGYCLLPAGGFVSYYHTYVYLHLL